MSSSGPSTRPKIVMDKKKQETVPQGVLYALTEQDGINYGLLLRPIDVKNERVSVDLASIFSISGSKAEQAVKDAKDEETRKTAEQNLQMERDRKKEETQKLTNGLLGSSFQSKLLRASDVTSGKYILLPLPRDIRDSISINYSSANLGSFMAGIQLGSDLQTQIQGEGSVTDSAKNLGNYIVRAAIDLLPNAGAAATALSGQVLNPYTQTVFENVELRSFNFEFVFQPKNVEESNNIRDIVNTIRYYALPEPDGLLLNVPWYWELAFYGQNADYLHAFSRCVLSRIDTNYSQDGFPVFTTANAPKTIVLTLEFKEVFPLNKKVINTFNHPSMTPSGSFSDSDTNTGNNETEQQTNPEDGTPAQQPDRTEEELKKQIRDLDSELSTVTSEIARLNQYLLRTDLTAKQRSDATAEYNIKLKHLEEVKTAKQAAENQLNGG